MSTVFAKLFLIPSFSKYLLSVYLIYPVPSTILVTEDTDVWTLQWPGVCELPEWKWRSGENWLQICEGLKSIIGVTAVQYFGELLGMTC